MDRATHASPSLLPLDQQMLTLDLDGRRLLARIVACDESGRLSLVVFDVDLGVRGALERLEPLSVEYVKIGLCRAVFTPLRVEDTGGPRAPLVLVQGRIGAVDSVQRRDNYRVRLALPVEVLLLNGAADREAMWRAGRSVNVSVEGICIETAHELRRGDVVTVRLHTELRVLEADARVLGPRPAPESALSHYGMQLIQIPRADQQLLTVIIKKEEQRGLAYRIGR